MNEELIEHRLNVQDDMLSDHAKRIDKLEVTQAATNERLLSLCEKIESQTKAIYWLIGLGATSLVGFFFYAIQQHIFR